MTGRNFSKLCISLHILHNHYQIPAKLSVPTNNCQNKTFLSGEGCTQGDPAAMAFYALGVKPLVDKLASCIKKDKCMQSWYAIDRFSKTNKKEIETAKKQYYYNFFKNCKNDPQKFGEESET